MAKWKNRIPAISGILILAVLVIAVAAAWTAGQYRYDLRLSFSEYVGMRRATAVLYFICAAVCVGMLIYYIARTGMPRLKRAVYGAAFLCIFGTALFPCNSHNSVTVITLHNDFAIGLMLAVTASFLLSGICAKTKQQRIAAVVSILYAAVFIVMFFGGFAPLFQTFFIWENLFIALLLLGLHMEQYGEECA